MAKRIVVFSSKYGSTKQYADWIGRMLGAKVIAASDASGEMLKAYDLVIFGTHLHVGKIMNSEFITRNWGLLDGKKVILFTASGSPSKDPSLKAAFNDAFPEEIRKKMKYFAFPGRLGKLDLADSILMLFPKTMLYLSWVMKRDEKSKKLFERMRKGYDNVKKENIFSLVKEAKS
jgi:menaquinone-dependent protoporphyrinogen oxidase